MGNFKEATIPNVKKPNYPQHNGDYKHQNQIQIIKPQLNNKSKSRQIEEQKRKRAEKAIKVQLTKERLEKEKITRLEKQYQEKLNTISREKENQRLALNAKIESRKRLAEKRAADNEARRCRYLTQREQHLQALQEDKSFGRLRRREEEHVNRLDEIRAQEIQAAHAKYQRQNTNLQQFKRCMLQPLQSLRKVLN